MLLAEKMLPYHQACQTIDSNLDGSISVRSHFHISSNTWTDVGCTWLLMMERQTRSHCQIKDIQYLATNPAGPNGWFLGIPPVAIS